MSRLGRTSGAGFSLVETLIVLAIAGIVVSMGYGYIIAARPHALVEQTEALLISTLNQARYMAISEEVNTKVAFNFDTNEFWIERQDRATNEWQVASPLTQLHAQVDIAAADVTFPAGEVCYTPRGTLVSGGSVTFNVINTEDESTLQGNIVTGRFEYAGGNLR